MCHIDLSNFFWLLRLPKSFRGAFRISGGEGGVLSFGCLPFGGKYSPILCQKALERLVGDWFGGDVGSDLHRQCAHQWTG